MTARNFAPIVALFGIFSAAAFFVSPGSFTVDEFIYFTGADAFANGSLTVRNGPEWMNSPQQRLWLLVEGPNGLTPQYPVGSAVVGGALLALFGLPGLILMNALAASGVVVLTYRLAMRHFGGHNVGLGAAALLVASTFFLEFAFAVWPHAVAMLAVLTAVYWLLESLGTDEIHKSRVLTIGGVLGAGLFFRTDVAVSIPAVGICLFFWSAKPVARLFWFGLGLAPFILALSLVNLQKFGVFNPVSYGQSHGGGTDLATHLLLLLLLAVGTVAALTIRWVWLNTGYRRHVIVAGALAILIGLILAHEFAWSYLHGFWALFVDARFIIDDRSGVERLADGTVSFWGLWKKALGQSMPWLGICLAAIFVKERTSSHALRVFLVLCLVGSLPFFPRDWHGGMGSNMRYFLPLVPVACALAARLIAELWDRTPAPSHVLPLGVFAGAMLTTLWALLHPSGQAGVHQIMPTYLLLGIAALALAAGYLRFERPLLNLCLMALTGAGVGVGFQLAITDFRGAQDSRGRAEEYSAAHLALPDDALAFVPSRFLVGWALEEGRAAALPNDTNGKFDTGLIDDALERNTRVFIWPHYVNDQLRDDARYELVETDIGLENSRLFELVRRQDP